MVLGEEMFSGGQDVGREGEGTVEMYGESSKEQDEQRSEIRPDCVR